MPKKLQPLPSPEQASEGLHTAAATAEQHLTVAEALSGLGHHGPACSHLILAQEEAVKARALGWIWLERDYDVKTYDEQELRERLSGHPARHKAAIVQSWSGGLQGEILARSLREAIRDEAARRGASWGDLQLEVGRRGGRVPDLPSRGGWEQAMATKYPDALDDDWPDEAADLKNRGFYTDQLPDGTWRSPHDVTVADYARALSKVKPMVEQVRRLILLSGA